MPFFLQYPEWISPEVIPGLPLRWYGLMYIFAFITTFLLCKKQIASNKSLSEKINDDQLTNMFFWGIFGLLLGARLFAGIFYDPSGKFLHQPWLLFWPFDSSGNFVGLQGMSYHGGLVGAIVGAVLYIRKNKLPLLEVGDVITTAVPLGYTFGRLGNFFNAELYGRVTTGWYGMIFPNAQRFSISQEWVQGVIEKTGIDPMSTMVNLPRHASQLYEAFLEGIVLFAIMWFIFRKRKPFSGFMMGLYLVGYGSLRFLAEYTRQPDIGLGYIINLSGKDPAPYMFETPFAFSMGQIFCMLMIIAGISLWLGLRIYHNRPQKLAIEPTDPYTQQNQNISQRMRKKLKN